MDNSLVHDPRFGSFQKSNLEDRKKPIFVARYLSFSPLTPPLSSVNGVVDAEIVKSMFERRAIPLLSLTKLNDELHVRLHALARGGFRKDSQIA